MCVRVFMCVCVCVRVYVGIYAWFEKFYTA